MSRAIPGAPYTVVQGDNLSNIAKEAYGDGRRWREIWKANKTTLKSGDPNLIYPGEVIQIPGDTLETEVAKILDLGVPTLAGKEKDDFTIVIDGNELVVESGRVLRTMDTCADGWTASLAFNSDDKKMNDLLKPFKYRPAQCYLGEKQVIDGYLYNIENIVAPDGIKKTLEGFSKTIDIVDSVTKPPYEANKVTLEQRAKDLVEPLGISVVFDENIEDEPFDRVTASPEETIFSHLNKLASQRGILMTSTPRGELLFTRAVTAPPASGFAAAIPFLPVESVGTIEEGLPLTQSFTARFDGRARFNAYTAIGKSPARKSAAKKNSKTATSKDNTVPKSRFTAFNSDETTIGNIQQAADWRRSKQLAETLAIPFPVDKWYAPNGDLWAENTIVTVKAPSLHIPDGFDFLIKQVEFVFETGGTRATLQLIPPQAFTGEPIQEPWL